jgi:hypothetical protein
MYRPLIFVQALLLLSATVSASVFSKHFSVLARSEPPTLEFTPTQDIQTRQVFDDTVEEWIEECEEAYNAIDYDHTGHHSDITFKRECGVIHSGYDTLGDFAATPGELFTLQNCNGYCVNSNFGG